MTAILEGAAYLQRLKPAEMVMPAQDNMRWVLDRQINYPDALHRPDLGWISFLWGQKGDKILDYEDGYGIANILSKAPGSEDIILQAVEVLARGKVKRRHGPPGNRRVDLTWRGFVVTLAWQRGRKTWYLAGWKGLEFQDTEGDQVKPRILESVKIDKEANKAAESPKNDLPKPTEAQKESGNYRKGHVRILGLDIAIENPAGSERSGTDRGGKKWTSKINHHYGYFKRTEGKDSDQVDVFLGPDPENADKVFVVNQVNPEAGKFDEHKVMMGFASKKEAEAAYLSNYMKGWEGLGSMVEMSVDEFKTWLKGDTTKPVGSTILEAAGGLEWKQAIQNAKTVGDIRVVFDGLFGSNTASSMVVDNKGNPLVLYHGTHSDWSETGYDFSNQSGDEFGAFFTTNPGNTSEYGPVKIKAHLSIKNPYEVTNEDWANEAGLSPKEAKDKGHDGYIIRGQDGGDTYIAFRNDQIKIISKPKEPDKPKNKPIIASVVSIDPDAGKYGEAVLKVEGEGGKRLHQQSDLYFDQISITEDKIDKWVAQLTDHNAGLSLVFGGYDSKKAAEADAHSVSDASQNLKIEGVKDSKKKSEKGDLPPLKKPGQKQSIMGDKDAVVTHAQRLDGVDYELYESGNVGYTRVFDADSGNTVGLKKYPSFNMALVDYAQAVKANGGSLEKGQQKEKLRLSIGDHVKPTKASGLNPELWTGEITHITRGGDGKELIAVNGKSQHYLESDFEKIPKPDKNDEIMESAKTPILEMAVDPSEIAHSNWEHAIERAEDMDDISNVFKILFGGNFGNQSSPYLKSTDTSIIMPLDKLVQRAAPDTKRIEHAHEYMKGAKEGTGEKRAPISVLAMGNGKYKILDGNTTFHALQELGEGKAIVEIKKTLKQPGVETIEDLYKQAEEAQPLFSDYMAKWAKKTGGRAIVRPGLKNPKRSREKVDNDVNGTFAGLKDILAGTLVFDTVKQVAKAFRMIENDDSVYRIKNRYERPMKSGYRDIFMNVAMSNGHVAELQLNTQGMIDAKETGLGHKIYDVTRQLSPVAEKGQGDARFIARGAYEELEDLSRKVYGAAVQASAARSAAKASANDLASTSEMTEELDRILKAMSESSTLRQLDLELPPIENVSQDSLSNTNGESSYSKNSNAMVTPPVDLKIGDQAENVKIKGRNAKAFLHDNTSVDVQYAVLEVENIKTSHSENLTKNDAYPQEIQPRQRDRDAMRLQVEEMAQKLNPERMGQSPLASSGAPIVGPDLAVESGNGRTIALRKAYANGAKGQEYREWLVKNASQFGIQPGDVEALEKPVLVRIRTSPVEDRAKFAEDANKDEIAKMSPAELARMDAQNLTDADLAIFQPDEEGNLNASSNSDFVKKFISKMGVNEATGYLTQDGRATKQLIDRVQAAVFQKAYDDDSLLALMAEEADPKLRNVLNALTFSAGEFSKCKGFDENLGGINIPSHAIGAMKLIQKSRDQKISIDGMLSQMGMFEEIPEGTATFAKFIDGNIRSGKRMGRVFKEAAKLLRTHLANENQGTLFGKEPDPTPSEIISRAIQKVEDDYYDGKQKGLFEDAGDNGKSSRSSEPGGSGRRTGNDMADPGEREMILEKSSDILAVRAPWSIEVNAAKTVDDIKNLFMRLFGKNDKASEYGLKVHGIKAREKLNARTREILESVRGDASQLTQEDIATLKQYSGKGGLTDNSQYEYYTPTHVAEGLWDAMKANGFDNGNILDPSTGGGVFSGTKPKGAIITGCDLDAVGSQVAQLLNPDDLIENKSFEKLAVETPDNTFDGVITNVPFGSARGAAAHEDPAYKSEKRIERYFILRALDKIKPGKLACFVAPINIVGAKGGKWEQWRTLVSKKAEFMGAHKLPSKTFGAQGTDTVTDIVVFKKHPESLLEKIDDLVLETLQDTNILWDEFISGMYWQGEGRKFIMGKYTPKLAGDRWSRETVDGDVDNEALKKKLALRFNSRIDWEALEVAEPAEKHHANGDRRIINGSEYEFQNGDWAKISIEKDESMVLESAKYGAGSIDELKAILESPKSSLKLTAKQAFSVYKSFPELLTPLQKNSVELAISQPQDKYREQIWRGSIVGGMISRYSNLAQDPDNVDAESMRLELQELVTAEIQRYGHPKENKGLVLTGETSKTFGYFFNAVDETGNFSDLLASGKSIDRTQYDETNVRSIVEHLFIREGIVNIELEDIQKLYAGKREITSLADVADDDNVALTPDGFIQPMSRFAAGDIYFKMKELTDAMANEPDEKIKEKYQKQIDLIMSKRKTTNIEDVTFGLQQKWFGRKYIVDFLKTNGYQSARYVTERTVEREDPITGEMEPHVEYITDDYDNPNGTFSVGDGSGWHKQFGKFLNGKNVTSSKADITYISHN